MSSAHRAVHRLKSFALHGSVGVKPHEESIGGSENRMRQARAAESTQNLGVFAISVVKFAVIVAALLMRFHLEMVELQFDAMTGRGGKVPRAVLPAGIKVGPVGTTDFSLGVGNFVLATALLAVHFILVQSEPVMAVTFEGSDRILAYVLTTSVLYRTLVAIREEERLKSGFLHRIVGVKLDSHEIGLGGDNGRNGRSAKDAVHGTVGAGAGRNGASAGKSAFAENDVAADVGVRRRTVTSAGFPASHFQRIVFAVLVVAFQIEVSKVKRDSILRRRLDLPNAVLVGWVQFGEGRRSDSAVDGFDVATARVLASFAVRMEFEADSASALVPSEGVDAFVLASVVGGCALVVLLHEAGRESGLLHAAVADEFDVEFVGFAFDVVGDRVTAEFADERGSFVVTVSDLQVVVDAAVVVLDFEGLEFEGAGVGFRDGNLPNAFFAGPIVVGIIGAAQLAAFQENFSSATRLVLGLEPGTLSGACGAIFYPHSTPGGDEHRRQFADAAKST